MYHAEKRHMAFGSHSEVQTLSTWGSLHRIGLLIWDTRKCRYRLWHSDPAGRSDTRPRLYWGLINFEMRNSPGVQVLDAKGKLSASVMAASLVWHGHDAAQCRVWHLPLQTSSLQSLLWGLIVQS
jgi:hypothetical protein